MAYALVFGGKHAEPRVFSRKFLRDDQTTVGATIIDNDDLNIIQSLRRQALQAGPEVLLRVIDGHDDAYLTHLILSPALSSVR